MHAFDNVNQLITPPPPPQEFRGADGGEDNARVKNRLVAKAVAQVLELESVGELCFALTTLRTETRGQQ